MIPGLHVPEFDPVQHSYAIGGKSSVGVTTVINSAVGVNPFWTVEGREAGKATHAAIQYYDENDLGFLAEETKPRLDAYIKFCNETQFKPDLIEQPLYHPTFLYCGIPDMVQIGRCVVDFKNGPHLPQHSLQTAAYANMLPNPLRYERWTVQLRVDGTYKLEPYLKQELTNDFNVFLSMLNSYNWRKRCLPQSLNR